ncbi:chemotaxis protein CheW [Roseomonas sp. GC11]|uniref:chemotaxis protein CheW n=1 Tax=Roseomonas sp. GC11 TaxID=2950546 RepID=UPI00210C8F01|nr:chemotaxis protein CheW [Roseomonas sp. GC11]MCQ4162872.1 chemotaxis protein CheW [Roseomonas sp. GC11]
MSAALAQDTLAGRQFVTFWVQDEVFGVPLSEVQEIIRMPGLVRVPMAAASLEGIANLRGAVLPVTSLRRIFALRDAPHDDATRIVVINRGALSGFVVDRMASVITTEAHEIEPFAAAGQTVRSDLLQGVVKRDRGMILLLDPDSLQEAAAPGEGARREGHGPRGGEEGAGLPRGAAAEARGGDELQLVSFEVEGQEYAFPIEDVQEIVQVPPRINVVPRSESHVMGVMTLRNRLLPLVSLRRMFGMPQAPLAEHNRIVVVALAGPAGPVSVGIVMDAVKEVLRVPRAVVEAVPPLLASSGQGGGRGGELEAICRLEQGRRLVTILSVSRMFPEEARERLLGEGMAAQAAAEEEAMAQQDQGGAAADDEEQFVVFRLGHEEYGVPIGAVQEIVRVPEQLTRMPRTPDFIEGVVNLRGVVLPVVDQRRRFGMPDMARNDRQRIMVLMVGQARTGFIVDSVVEVLKVPRATIGPAPRLGGGARLIDRVANLEKQKRMLQLLEAGHLLDLEEQGALNEL